MARIGKIEEEGNGDLRAEKSNLRQMVEAITLASLTTNSLYDLNYYA